MSGLIDVSSLDDGAGGDTEMPRKPQSAGDLRAQATRQALAGRVTQRMEALGLKIKDVVVRSGLSQTSVYNIKRGDKSSNPSLPDYYALAQALECHIVWLIGATDYVAAETRTATLPVKGVAKVGAYVAVTESSDGSLGHVQDIVPLDPRLQDIARFPILVDDDSLEGLSPPVPRGYVAMVVDFAATGLDVESGRVYMVLRRNSDGQVETSFRRATVYRDRYEFTPVTSSATRNAREKLTVPRPQGSDEVHIAGLFYGASHQYHFGVI